MQASNITMSIECVRCMNCFVHDPDVWALNLNWYEAVVVVSSDINKKVGQFHPSEINMARKQ